MTSIDSGSGKCMRMEGEVVVKRLQRCKAHPAMYSFCSRAVRFYSYPVRVWLTRATIRVSVFNTCVIMANPVSYPTEMYMSMGA